MLNQCIDSLVQKVQNGVVINFEKIGPDPPLVEKTDEKEEVIGLKEGEFDDRLSNQPLLSTSWHNCRKMIYVPKSSKSYCVGKTDFVAFYGKFKIKKNNRFLAYTRVVLA